jgi:diaminohydroxyphosphoribosylaminopyrimidine deaminase/5-amino-6-(5-phosphoribosylamino)uracil reductase
MNDADGNYMLAAIDLARKGYGCTSPNPMVGALLVKDREVIGKGWHKGAGKAHAEIEAMEDARQKNFDVKGSTLYVTLEPCSTFGRTPPCAQRIIDFGLKCVVIAATDPNPKHSGNAYHLFHKAGVEVRRGVLEKKAIELNAAFNHWITNKTPYVTVKAAMTLDGKIALENGESRWITSKIARQKGMRIRNGMDAILVGIETVLADDPCLTIRDDRGGAHLRRVVLDSSARTPLEAKVVANNAAGLTTIVVLKGAPRRRLDELRRRVNVIEAPTKKGRIDLKWLLKHLGKENIISLLVEGGGRVNAAFLIEQLVQRVAFFYAPKILGGSRSRMAVAGSGVNHFEDALRLTNGKWRKLGSDLLLTACVSKD